MGTERRRGRFGPAVAPGGSEPPRMETYKIVLARDDNEPQGVVLRAILEVYGGLDRARATAIVTDLLAGRESAIHGFSSDEAQRFIEKIGPHGVRCSIEPNKCPTCHSPLIRVLNHWRWLSPAQRALISSGRAILGPDDAKPTPDRVCLACLPEWRDFHRIAFQLEEWQSAKEESLAAQDFDNARLLRDRQQELRPRLQAVAERLRGRS